MANFVASVGLEAKADGEIDAISGELSEAAMADLIQQRQTARQQRNFAKADQIRDQVHPEFVIPGSCPQLENYRSHH